MMKIHLLGNRNGQTIVEALVALGLISVIGLTFAGGMVSLRNTSKASLMASATDRQVSDIAENIKAGVQEYQVNFNYDQTKIDDYLPVDKLPMLWDVGRVAERGSCDTCKGSYGYIIQPYEVYRGLYLVTLRMTHESWAPDKFRDYTFVVSAK
ncbi:type IV pilus modification PilV family protein [Bdellovibrio sp. HCB274]|uniref:type IV pilus modification PilV family protein n=1 Tax=Bdellovibrio sp. HCB274 TaxID=3394361 RepID=UPI0039B52766